MDEVSCNFGRRISKNIVVRRWPMNITETYRSFGFCFINFLIWDWGSANLGRVPKIDVLGIMGRVFCRQIGTPGPRQFLARQMSVSRKNVLTPPLTFGLKSWKKEGLRKLFSLYSNKEKRHFACSDALYRPTRLNS